MGPQPLVTLSTTQLNTLEFCVHVPSRFLWSGKDINCLMVPSSQVISDHNFIIVAAKA